MKKLLITILTLIFTGIMSLCVYGDVSGEFNYYTYADGKYYSVSDIAGNTTELVNISDKYSGIYVADDYFYFSEENDNNGTDIYRCDKDLNNTELFISLPPDSCDVQFYNNTIFYNQTIYTADNLYHEFYSINIDTKEKKKYLTYYGYGGIIGISNDYIIYSFDDYDYNVGHKIYKQNINNPSDRKLLLYSNADTNVSLLGEKNLYVYLNYTLSAINLNTGKITSTYDISYNSDPICEYKGYLYIAQGNKVYKALENGTLNLISENNDMAMSHKPLIIPYRVENAIILFYLREYDGDYSTKDHFYSYNIATNKWTDLGTETINNNEY